MLGSLSSTTRIVLAIAPSCAVDLAAAPLRSVIYPPRPLGPRSRRLARAAARSRGAPNRLAYRVNRLELRFRKGDGFRRSSANANDCLSCKQTSFCDVAHWRGCWINALFTLAATG